MTHERLISPAPHTYSDAEVEDRVSQLKLLAGLLPRSVDRARCLAELLHVRSEQLQAHIRARVP